MSVVFVIVTRQSSRDERSSIMSSDRFSFELTMAVVLTTTAAMNLLHGVLASAGYSTHQRRLQAASLWGAQRRLQAVSLALSFAVKLTTLFSLGFIFSSLFLDLLIYFFTVYFFLFTCLFFGFPSGGQRSQSHTFKKKQTECCNKAVSVRGTQVVA